MNKLIRQNCNPPVESVSDSDDSEYSFDTFESESDDGTSLNEPNNFKILSLNRVSCSVDLERSSNIQRWLIAVGFNVSVGLAFIQAAIKL